VTTLSHILSGSYIALYTRNIDPSQTQYVIAALVSSGAIDLDHIYSLIKDRKIYQQNGYSGNLHKARSFLHELFGYAIIGIAVLAFSFINPKMAYVIGVSSMIHLTEDVMVGISIPFNPIDKTEINLLPQKQIIKIILDVFTIVIFGFLWIKYLSEQN
jgi:hypothetical protein